MAITVKALQRGYYDLQLREPGAIFTIATEQEFGKWMEKVSADAAQAHASDDSASKKPVKGKRPSDESKI